MYVGMRNWKPYIRDQSSRCVEDGITSAVVICLAPQNSRTSVGLYKRAVETAAGDRLRIDFVEGWADDPLLAEAFAERLRPLWHTLSQEIGDPVPVLFTAHSVPQRTVEAGTETSQLILMRSRRSSRLRTLRTAFPGLKDWRFAFQSQGMSGGPWIGPTVEDTLTALRKEGTHGGHHRSDWVPLRPCGDSVRHRHRLPRLRQEYRPARRAAAVAQ